MTEVPIRDAATIIVVRDRADDPKILLGQRGSGAVFMPDKFVFPGGAVDPADALVPLAAPIDARTKGRLEEASKTPPEALVAAAVRELWEETGLVLGRPGPWDDAPTDWREFARAGFRPSPAGLEFVFRAITPPGRPRRFDARFFAADADLIAGDPDDFSRASDELANLTWLSLDAARKLDLPFITRIVLAEVGSRLPRLDPPATVPFFASDEEERLVRHLGLRSW